VRASRSADCSRTGPACPATNRAAGTAGRPSFGHAVVGSPAVACPAGTLGHLNQVRKTSLRSPLFVDEAFLREPVARLVHPETRGQNGPVTFRAVFLSEDRAATADRAAPSSQNLGSCRRACGTLWRRWQISQHNRLAVCRRRLQAPPRLTKKLVPLTHATVRQARIRSGAGTTTIPRICSENSVVPCFG
jgi:hypothetical protein